MKYVINKINSLHDACRYPTGPKVVTEGIDALLVALEGYKINIMVKEDLACALNQARWQMERYEDYFTTREELKRALEFAEEATWTV